MDCEEKRVDIREHSQEEIERTIRNSQLIFKISRSAPSETP